METIQQPEDAAGARADLASPEQPAFQPLQILIVDCETRRFTIDGPTERIDAWCKEVQRAVNAGRRIFCTPFSPVDLCEIEALCLQLGFDKWPSRTIVSPPSQDEDRSFHRDPPLVARQP